jgi:hypothetical protein
MVDTRASPRSSPQPEQHGTFFNCIMHGFLFPGHPTAKNLHHSPGLVGTQPLNLNPTTRKQVPCLEKRAPTNDLRGVAQLRELLSRPTFSLNWLLVMRLRKQSPRHCVIVHDKHLHTKCSADAPMLNNSMPS